MKQPFKTEELKAELERALQFRICSLKRLICVNSGFLDVEG